MGMKTKVAEDLDLQIHMLKHAGSIYTFVIIPNVLNFSDKNYLLESHAYKSNKSTHFLLYTIALKISV
jgi:hypothetical protein